MSRIFPCREKTRLLYQGRDVLIQTFRALTEADAKRRLQENIRERVGKSQVQIGIVFGSLMAHKQLERLVPRKEGGTHKFESTCYTA